MDDDPLRPLFKIVSPEGVTPEQAMVTGLGREIAGALGLATPIELVGVVGLAVRMLENNVELYRGKGLGAPLGDLVAAVRHGDVRYLPREYAFKVAGTGERVPLDEVPPGLELLNAHDRGDDPPPLASEGLWKRS